MAAKFLVAKAVVIAFVWPANASEPNIVIANGSQITPRILGKSLIAKL
jgi:hypothetical protein